jgi:hypothetical protein
VAGKASTLTRQKPQNFVLREPGPVCPLASGFFGGHSRVSFSLQGAKIGPRVHSVEARSDANLLTVAYSTTQMYAADWTDMNEDPRCKRCEHPLSMHNMGRAQKRANVTGTMVSDYPSGEGYFNYHSGLTDNDACSNPDCDCIMFMSRV